MTLGPYIQELLAHRNYVILSGFGAFQPGRLLPVEVNENGELVPPRRTVNFNPLLTYSDDTLARFIAEREQREVEHVVEALSQLVFEWKTELNHGKEVSVPGVGTFIKLKSLIELKPEETLQVHRESFGLPVIKRPQAQSAADINVSAPPDEPKAVETLPLPPKKISSNAPTGKSVKRSATDAWYAFAMVSFAAAVASMLYVFSTLYTSFFS